MIPEKNIILTTTSKIEDRKISTYLGLVTGQVVMGTNVIKDLIASVKDIVGGRTKGFEDYLKNAKQEALEDLKFEALDMGANAVLGIKVDIETLGSNNSMLLISVVGTAVVVD